MQGITEEIVSFVDRTRYKAFSVKARQKAKYSILDGIGVSIAGINDHSCTILADYIRNQQSVKEVSPLGQKWKTSVTLAALLNGVAMHMIDFDDVSWTMVGHPTTVILPVCLAVGGKLGVSGREFLSAYIIGSEIACKIGMFVNPSLYKKGFHATSTIGVFGAAAAAGRLLQLTATQLKWAFGIAGSCSSGIRGNFGTMVKPFQVGKACESGVNAAVLALKGFQGAPDILENEWGFSRVIAGNSAIPELKNKLGNPFDVESPGFVLKQYPSCAGTHPAIDAILELKKEYNLIPEKIKAVECGSDQQTLDMLKYSRPQTPLQGKFSMPYCIAAALVDGEVSLEHFTDAKIKNRSIKSLLPKITLCLDRKIAQSGYSSKSAARVTVILKNGKKLECFKDKPKGSPDIPLSESELLDKFRNCSKMRLPESKMNRVIDKVLSLECVTDVSELLRIVS